MKKIVGCTLCLLMLLCLSACGGNDNSGDYTDIPEQVSSIEESSSEESSSETKIDFEIPADIVGLIDIDEKPYTENKIFYNSGKMVRQFIVSDENPEKGKFYYAQNLTDDEAVFDAISKDWTYYEGIYILDEDKEKWFFMHDGYLITYSIIDNLGEKLSGSYETGFEGGEYHCFFKDGRYEYHPGREGVVTTTGNYKMLSKNIMKLTRRYNGQVIVDYHFISNSGQMYAAFSRKLSDYEV